MTERMDSIAEHRWNPWPVALIAFFTVAIAACATFVVFCNMHPVDLVSSDYYEQEVRYQGQLDRMQRGAEHPAEIIYDMARKAIRVKLPLAQTGPALAGQVHLYRPSAAGLDRKLKLSPDAKGVQTIDAAGLLPGLWEVRVSWTAERRDYFISRKVYVGGSEARS